MNNSNSETEAPINNPVLSEGNTFSCRFMENADAPAVRELFEKIFKEPMSQALWEWKYSKPNSAATLVFHGKDLVGHYGGVGRRVLLRGRPALCVQIGDVMVAPSARHAVRSQSPMYLSFDLFVSTLLGIGKRFEVAYGFPNDRALGLAIKLGFYAKVATMTQTLWPAERDNSWFPPVIQPLECSEFKKVNTELDHLWQLMAIDFSEALIGIRDLSWLDYRYFQRPHKEYELVLLRSRWTRKPLALIVVQQREEALWLMDFVGPLKHLTIAVKAVRQLAAQRDLQQVLSWCCTHRSEDFAATGAQLKKIPISIPTNNFWTDTITPDELKDRWWLMPGDTDFQ
jgi:hypothetical protein